MTCMATRSPIARPQLVEIGWVCDGTDLVIVLPASATLPPTVVRRDLLPYLDDASASFIPPSGAPEFTGSDHLHLRIPMPLPKPREVSDVVQADAE